MRKNLYGAAGLKKRFASRFRKLDRYDQAEILTIFIAIVICLFLVGYYQDRVNTNKYNLDNEDVKDKANVLVDTTGVKIDHVTHVVNFY